MTDRTRALAWALAAALATALLLAATSGEVGIGIDESRYLQRTMAMAYYLRDAAAALGQGELARPFAADFIDAYFYRFPYLPAHPDFFRLVNAACWYPLRGALGNYAANRIGNQLVAALIFMPAFLLFLRARHGWRVAVFFTVALLANGRVFHELHLANFDAAVMMMVWLAIYTATRAGDSWRGALLAAVVLGCALNTKAQALCLYGGLIAAALARYDRGARRLLLAALTVAPLVYWLGRPWLWHDPLGKLFDTARYYQAWGSGTAAFGDYHKLTVWFLGEQWTRSGAAGGCPWYYLPVMLAATLPLFLLALLPAGALALWWRRGRAELLLLGTLAAFALAAFVPGAPRYDGVRLYVVIFPLLYALAAEGYAALRARHPFFAGRRASAGYAVILLATVAQTLAVRPYYEMYYSDTVGGVPGAAALGLEAQYTGGCVNGEFVREVLQPLPDGTRLLCVGYDFELLAAYRETGLLTRRLVAAPAPPQDAILILNRQGMFDERTPALLSEHPLLRAAACRGVPVWWLVGIAKPADGSYNAEAAQTGEVQ